jgi:catalase
LKFLSAEGKARYGRFQVHPVGGNYYLSPEAQGNKSPDFLFEELSERFSKGPAKFRIVVQIAGAEDEVDNSTVVWPADRELIEFGEFTLSEIIDGNEPENKKIIFDPIPRVKGIEPSEDPLLNLRAAIYLISGRRRRAESK